MESGSINARPEPPQHPGLRPGRAGEKGLPRQQGRAAPRREGRGGGAGGGRATGPGKPPARWAEPRRGVVALPASCGGNPRSWGGNEPPLPSGKRGPRGLLAGFSHRRRVAFPATGANCKRPIKSKRGKVINGPFAFKRGPRPGLPRLGECPTRRRDGEERGYGSGSGGSLNSRVPLAAGPFGEVNQLPY